MGYIIDIFHLIKCGAEFNGLKEVIKQIFLIQLSDIKYEENVDLASMMDSERIIPGEGDFNLKSFLKMTNKYGYRNPFSLELAQNDLKDSKNQLKRYFEIFKSIK